MEPPRHAPRTGKIESRLVKDRLIPGLAACVPLSVWQRLVGVDLLLPYYHIVSDEEVPHIRHLYAYRNLRDFQRDLDFFLSHYQPVGLSDLVDHLTGVKVLPRNSFHLTFDDGFREMHDVVGPILRAKGISATFFLSTDFLDNADMAHHLKLSVLVEE